MSLPRPPRWIFWWAGFVAFGVLALGLTALAYREMLPGFVRAHDKASHFLLSGALVFFLDGVLGRRTLLLRGRAALSIAWIAVLLPEGVEEYLQRYATFRTSELGDYLADVAGATVCLWLSRLVDGRSRQDR